MTSVLLAKYSLHDRHHTIPICFPGGELALPQWRNHVTAPTPTPSVEALDRACLQDIGFIGLSIWHTNGVSAILYLNVKCNRLLAALVRVCKVAACTSVYFIHCACMSYANSPCIDAFPGGLHEEVALASDVACSHY